MGKKKWVKLQKMSKNEQKKTPNEQFWSTKNPLFWSKKDVHFTQI